MPFAQGENVGPYRIVEKLGQGGMATVYKAYHPALDRYVAIKVMHPAFMEDPNFLARFQREARIVAKLDHPSITPIYDFAEHEGYPYLVMRFVQGETLKARLQEGPLDEAEFLRIARAVGEALTYAHEKGVLHRDIKPSNVLLTPEGHVYLTDFGLARMAEAGESTLSRDMMVGTPQYISPEQAKGLKDLDARTDVYSFGVVLYEILVGQAPFTADTPFAIIHDHIFSPLPMPREINPEFPALLERVLLKALAKEPDDRYSSVAALVEALESALAPSSDGAERTTDQQIATSETNEARADSEGTEEAEASEPAVAPPAPAPPSADRSKGKRAPKKRRNRKWLWIGGVAFAFVCLLAFLLGLAALNDAAGSNAGALLEEARAAREGEDLETALSLYEEAAKTDPSLVAAYVEASDLLMKSDDAEAAVDVLEEGLDANPDDYELHLQLAEAGLWAERWDEAMAGTQWLLDNEPQDAVSHAFAAVVPLAMGHACQETEPELERAQEIDPNEPWGHYGRALCHLAPDRDDPQAAAGELRRLLEAEPVSPHLRAHAERLLVQIEPEPAPPEAYNETFELLLTIAQGIENDELRREFKGQIEALRASRQEGNRLQTIRLLRGLLHWLRENRQALDPEDAEELEIKLQIIIRAAEAEE